MYGIQTTSIHHMAGHAGLMPRLRPMTTLQRTFATSLWLPVWATWTFWGRWMGSNWHCTRRCWKMARTLAEEWQTQSNTPVLGLVTQNRTSETRQFTMVYLQFSEPNAKCVARFSWFGPGSVMKILGGDPCADIGFQNLSIALVGSLYAQICVFWIPSSQHSEPQIRDPRMK